MYSIGKKDGCVASEAYGKDNPKAAATLRRAKNIIATRGSVHAPWSKRDNAGYRYFD